MSVSVEAAPCHTQLQRRTQPQALPIAASLGNYGAETFTDSKICPDDRWLLRLPEPY
jgi:hypothetical protein